MSTRKVLLSTFSQVTNTASLNESAADFNSTAAEIYELAGLGNQQCDNGMLLFYVKDTQEVGAA